MSLFNSTALSTHLKKLFALVLTLAMLAGLLPVVVLASPSPHYVPAPPPAGGRAIQFTYEGGWTDSNFSFRPTTTSPVAIGTSYTIFFSYAGDAGTTIHIEFPLWAGSHVSSTLTAAPYWQAASFTFTADDARPTFGIRGRDNPTGSTIYFANFAIYNNDTQQWLDIFPNGGNFPADGTAFGTGWSVDARNQTTIQLATPPIFGPPPVCCTECVCDPIPRYLPGPSANGRLLQATYITSGWGDGNVRFRPTVANALTDGHEYTLYFSYAGTAAFRIMFPLWNHIWGTVTPSTEWQVFSHTFTASSGVEAARPTLALQYYHERQGQTVYFGNFALFNNTTETWVTDDVFPNGGGFPTGTSDVVGGGWATNDLRDNMTVAAVDDPGEFTIPTFLPPCDLPPNQQCRSCICDQIVCDACNENPCVCIPVCPDCNENPCECPTPARVDALGQVIGAVYPARVDLQGHHPDSPEGRAILNALWDDDELWMQQFNRPSNWDEWSGLQNTNQIMAGRYSDFVPFEATGFFNVQNRVLDGETRSFLINPLGNIYFHNGWAVVADHESFTQIGGTVGGGHTAPDNRMDLFEYIPNRGTAGSTWWNAFRSGGNTFSFMAANMIRRYGSYTGNTDRNFHMTAWERMERFGFTGLGEWSTQVYSVEQEALAAGFTHKPFFRNFWFSQVPYLHGDYTRGLYDVFHPNFAPRIDAIFAAEAVHANDPRVLGFSWANEIRWNMLWSMIPEQTAATSGVKARFTELMQDHYETMYGEDNALAQFRTAWGISGNQPSEWFGTGANTVQGRSLTPTTDAARADMEFVLRDYFDVFYGTIAAAAARHVPNHMVMGDRWLHGVMLNPLMAEILVEAAGRHLHAITWNYYAWDIDTARMRNLYEIGNYTPFLLSEWHFGDTSTGRTWGAQVAMDEEEKGSMYRNYVERAAASGMVIGSNWFTYMDQPATGRYFDGPDGESGAIGMFTVVNRPYRTLLTAVAETNHNIYDFIIREREPHRHDFLPGQLPRFGTQLYQAPRIVGLDVNDLDHPSWNELMTTVGATNLDFNNIATGVFSTLTSANFYVGWDGEYIFFRGDITTPNPMNARHVLLTGDWDGAHNTNLGQARWLWAGNAIELFFGPDDPFQGGAMLARDRQLLAGVSRGTGLNGSIPGQVYSAHTWHSNSFNLPFHGFNDDAHVRVNGRLSPTNPNGAFTIAIQIPLAELYWHPTEGAEPFNDMIAAGLEGTRMRFEMGFSQTNAADGYGRERQYMWHGEYGAANTRQNWGMLMLVDNILPVNTVEFDLNGSIVQQQPVILNGFVQTPESPRRPGMFLEGWYMDDAFTTPWMFESDLYTAGLLDSEYANQFRINTSGTVIYAKMGNLPRVSFDANAQNATGTMRDLFPISVGANFRLPLNNFTNPGHNFLGWVIDGVGDILPERTIIQVSEDIVLVAQWESYLYEPTRFNVTVVSQNATGYSGGGEFTVGATVNVDAGVHNDNYTFVSWTSNPAVNFAQASSPTTSFEMIEANVTVTANWLPNEVTPPPCDDCGEYPCECEPDNIPAIVSVSVTPLTVNVQQGATRQFNANVSAVHGADPRVSWTVTGHNLASINASGLLTVGTNVPAGTTLTVRATSIFDTTKYSLATVTVTARPTVQPPIEQPPGEYQPPTHTPPAARPPTATQPRPGATIPANDGDVAIPIRVQGDRTILNTNTALIREVISSADEYATFDLSELDVTEVQIPRTAVRQLAEAEKGIEIILPNGAVVFDAEAAQYLGQTAQNNNIVLNICEANNLPEGLVLSPDQVAHNVTITVGNQTITNFNGVLTVSLPFEGSAPVGVWLVGDDGELQLVEIDADFDEETGLVTFTTDTIGVFVLGYAPEPAPEPDPPQTPPATQLPSIVRLYMDSTIFTHNGMPGQLELAPFIDPETNRTMVPLRLIVETLGMEVDWDETTQTVSIFTFSEVVTLVIGEQLPEGLGTAMIINDRTFVPLRFVAIALGVEVEWDDAARAVNVIM